MRFACGCRNTDYHANYVALAQICPFFLSRSILPDADIIFVPYNYLIDPLSRRSIGISIENSILIFDEAHNVVRTLHLVQTE